MDVDENDEIVSVLPIHYSNVLAPDIHIHQFPLLTRPLQVPPTAAASGKHIKARVKANTQRFEIHVPADTRSEVRNVERSKQLGAARLEDDKDKHQESKNKLREDEEPRLSEIRLRSEEIVQKGAHVLGILRNGLFNLKTSSVLNFTCRVGKLHLHPISEMHQLRPSLTYLDVLSRKNKRSRGGGESDSESDDGPPPDPDEATAAPPKKEKKSTGEVKEVHVTARKADDSGALGQGGMSAVRREMLHIIRAEEEDKWENFAFCDITVCLSLLYHKHNPHPSR